MIFFYSSAAYPDY